MAEASVTERVRAGIASELARLGVEETSSLSETILIRNGLFCGRKYVCRGHSVVWFIEENEIKFFGPTGMLLRTTSADGYRDSSNQNDRRAA